MKRYYSNEIVFRGHPDKVCDQISAAIGDALRKQDKNSRYGIETVGGKGKIFITGEIRSNAVINIEEITRRVLSDVGYSTDYEIINNLGLQSNDIAQGVDIGGAGDQGMMFGYAVSDNKEYLPTAQVILQKFAKWYDGIRKTNDNFLADGKAQITGVYDEDMNLLEIETFTVSYQNKEIDRDNTDLIIKMYLTDLCFNYDIAVKQFLINPTGKFLIGGFDGDAGLTGRKIVVDAYQSFANVGGGCMNGKDASKVDFSAAHKARSIAIRYLQEYKLRWCEVQLSYAIGVKQPLAIYIKSNIGDLPVLENLFEECEPNNIIKDLDLLNIDYEPFAQFGHFTKGE